MTTTNDEYLKAIAPIIADSLKNNSLLVVVGCTKLKIWDITNRNDIPKSIPAELVYKGPLFKQFLQFREALLIYSKINWKILSAKYGFIEPTTMISDYNISFNTKYDEVKNPYVTNDELNVMVNKMMQGEKNILLWCGKEYVERIKTSLNILSVNNSKYKDIKIFAPFLGLKIGVSLGHAKKLTSLVLEKCENI